MYGKGKGRGDKKEIEGEHGSNRDNECISTPQPHRGIEDRKEMDHPDIDQLKLLTEEFGDQGKSKQEQKGWDNRVHG